MMLYSDAEIKQIIDKPSVLLWDQLLQLLLNQTELRSLVFGLLLKIGDNNADPT